VAARLQPDLAGAGVAQADLVIEAIIENPDAKRDAVPTVEPRLKADALLTTNTSSIPLTNCAGTSRGPAQFAGLHYFNPVAQMPLVEIIHHDAHGRGDREAPGRVLQGLDKFPVPVAGTPGFLVNRVLFPYMLEAAPPMPRASPAR
jgi:3-hydroxyacyl-CoA dehydrogenase/enoyl-CoA hydratase/3-hydroxybutyryl-CoA epimerase